MMTSKSKNHSTRLRKSYGGEKSNEAGNFEGVLSPMEGYPITEASWIQAEQFSHPDQLQQYLEDDQHLQERV